MAWHLESWQPADGLAFISLRPEGAGPLQMFFVGAPHFQPVPVRGLSTAVWAARGTFQEWLVDAASPDGRTFRQIAFPSLSAIGEFVRRMFLAFGPGSQPHVGSPRPPRPPAAPATPLAVAALRTVLELDGKESRTRLREELGRLSGDQEYRASLRRLGIECLNLVPVPNPEEREFDEDRVALAVLLEKTGLWEGLGHILRDWVGTREKGGFLGLAGIPAWQSTRVTGSGMTVHPRAVRGLLFRIPSPVGAPEPYGDRLSSLGHHFCAATSDRAYLQTLSGDSLLPLYLAGLLLAAGTVDLLPGSPCYVTAVFERADAWIAAELPDRSLAEVAGAEEVITACLLRAIEPPNRAMLAEG